MTCNDWPALMLARLLVLPGDDLQGYFDTIGQIPVLKKQTELDLAELIWQGRLAQERLDKLTADFGVIPRECDPASLERDVIAGDEARIRIIVCNLRFGAWCARISTGFTPRPGAIREVEPGSFAEDNWGGGSMLTLRRYAGDSLPLADRVQAATIGLIKSAGNYAPHGRVRFTSFCRKAIHGELVDAIVTERYRVGHDLRYQARTTAKLVRQGIVLERTTGDKPTEDMLGSDTKLGPTPLRYRLEEHSRYPRYTFEDLFARMRLYDPVAEEWRQGGDFVWDPDAAEGYDYVARADLLEEFERIFATSLSEREAGVVAMRFGLFDGQPRTLDEIGRVFLVTRERVRQIESKTMLKLRHPSRAELLRTYLEEDSDWPWHAPVSAELSRRPAPTISMRTHPHLYDLTAHPELRELL